jgi:Tfp pilus assembly protein PilP
MSARSFPRSRWWLLAGCGSDIDELRQWMDQQRKEAKPT